MSIPLDYRSLFDNESQHTLRALRRELQDALSAHPAPPDYRERLRRKLMTAASNENFYRRDSARRVLVALTVVMTVLLSLVAFIVWRNSTHSERRLAPLSR
jgi:hypothetical protein